MVTLIPSLPQEVNDKIFSFLSHPLADMMRRRCEHHKTDNDYFRHEFDRVKRGNEEFQEMGFSHWFFDHSSLIPQAEKYFEYYLKHFCPDASRPRRRVRAIAS